MKIRLTIMLFILAGSCFAQNSFQWRGQNRTGIYNGEGLMEKWPEAGPDVAWVAEGLGEGHSSVSIYKNKIFTLGMTDAKGYLFCLDMKGTLLWKKMYGEEWSESFPGSRATPTVVDDKIYFVSGLGKAYCFKVEDGSNVWTVDLIEKFGARNTKWGITESPLIVDGKVIVTPGGEKDGVVALNKDTGETIWTCNAKGEMSAYCSPLLVDHNGHKIIVTHMANSIIGIEPKSGKLLWSHDQTNKWSVHANTPIYRDGYIYGVSGYGKGGVKLKLSADGSSVTEIWRNSTLDNQMGGAVLLNGNIYGAGQNNKSYQCLDWETGEQKYSISSQGKGVTIAAGNLLYCYADNGLMSLMQPGASEFVVKGSFKVEKGTGPHWAHPVIDNGIMYVRHGDALIAYKLK